MSTLHPQNDDDSHRDDATRARPGTIIWGAVTVIIGALILTGELTGLVLDPVLVVMGLLIGTGLALVVGGVVSMSRRNEP